MIKYSQKEKSIVLCSQCYFFLHQNDCESIIKDCNIFALYWQCPFCNKLNITQTDINYQYFIHSQQTLISQKFSEQNIVVLIQGNWEMKEKFMSVPSDYYCRNNNIGEITKFTMFKESELVKSYLEVLAAKERLKKGRGFSWDNFLKGHEISKFQYALWVTSFINNKFKNVKLAFYTLDQRNSDEKDKSIVLTNADQIGKKFFKDLLFDNNFSNAQQVTKFSQILCNNSQLNLVIIGNNDPQFLSSVPSHQKVTFLKVIDPLDPITLQKVSKIELPSNIACFHPKIDNINRTTEKSFISELIQDLSLLKSEACVFMKKTVSKKKAPGKVQWENILPFKCYSQNVIRRKNKKKSDYILDVKKYKIEGAVEECLKLVDENPIDDGLMCRISSILATQTKGIQIRAYLKFYVHATNSSYVYLWSTSKKLQLLDSNLQQREQSQFNPILELQHLFYKGKISIQEGNIQQNPNNDHESFEYL